MNKITYSTKLVLVLLLSAVLSITSIQKVNAQSCNQVEILYTAPECSDRPTAGPADPGGQGKGCKEVSVCVNQLYNYASSITGMGYTYNWTVSGPTAVTINPNNTSANINISWPQAGTYTLTLTVTGPSGNVFTTCLTIRAADRPNASFTFSPNNVCQGSTILFTGTTTFANNFMSSWNFGDPASGNANYTTVNGNIAVTHTYNLPGTYTVTLITYSFVTVQVQGPQGTMETVVKTCCADTATQQVTITPGTFKIECISTVCAGTKSTYTAVGCANPTWGTIVGGSAVAYPSANQITIQWGNGNPQGQITATCPGGCTATVPVPIIPTTPVIVGTTTPCSTSVSSYNLPLLPGTFYTWTLYNTSNNTYYNSAINTYPDNNTVWIDWNALPPGPYQLNVLLENKHICCTSNGSLTITPTGKWKAFIDQTICKGTNATLNATAGGNYNWTVLLPNTGVVPLSATATTTFNPNFANAGDYLVEVYENGTAFCNSGIGNPQQIKVKVIGVPTPGIIVGPATVCVGSNTNYSMSTPAPTGYHYEWTITGGAGVFVPVNTPPLFGDNVTIQWTTLPATISVVLRYNSAPFCSSPTVVKNITQATIGSISGNQNVCVDAQEIYTLSGGNLPAGENVQWTITPSSLGSVILGNGSNTPTIQWHGQVAGTGPWTATLTASSNCGNTSWTINIGRPPVGMLTQSGNICLGGATLTAPSGYTYLWSPGGQTSSSINVTSPGNYSCVITNGPCSITRTILVNDPFAIAPRTCGVGSCNGLATNEQLSVDVIKPGSGTFTYQWFQGTYPTGTSVAGPFTNTNLSNTYMATDSGWYYVVVNYGTCSKNVAFYVKKVCCPDINNIVFPTPVRNSCNNFTFSATTPNPLNSTITWSFGDGGTAAGVSGVPISHSYLHAGIYCVTFCVGPPLSPNPNPTNCKGNCRAQSVIVPLEAIFTYTLGCNGCININNQSIVLPISNAAPTVNFAWNFGDGSPVVNSASPAPPSHCYTAVVPTPYTVTLVITYTDPVTGLTCSSTAAQSFTYYPLDITINPSPVCSNTLTTFTSTPNTFISYAWNFGDTYSSYTSPTQHAYANVVSPTNYNVLLTVIDALGVTCTKTKTVTVNPGIANCTIQPAYICPGSSATLTAPAGTYTYQWQVETSPNVFANAPGASTSATYTTTIAGFYRVIIYNTYGCPCTSNKVEVKNVPKPKAIIAVAPSTKLCGPQFVSLASPNHLTGYTSQWYSSTWSLLYAFPNYNVNVPATTTFNLVLTNQYGCKDTCSLTITVNTPPAQPNITSSPTLCEGVPITLTVTNYPTNITWNNGANTSTITVVSAGVYTATYTDPVTGCTSSKSIKINRRPPTDLFPRYCDSIKCICRDSLGNATLYAPRPLVGLYATTYNIQWLFNGSPVGGNGNNPTFSPAQTGTYQIIVTDPITGCKDTSSTYSIVVPPCDSCDCKESHWGNINLTKGEKVAAKNNKANVPTEGIKLECKNKTPYALECNKPFTINANYICKDSLCPSKVTYTLTPPVGTPISGNVAFTYTPTVSGTYTVMLYGWCNNKICDSCLLTFIVKCDSLPKDCCKGSYWLTQPWYYFESGGKPNPTKIDCNKETVVVITGKDCKKPLVVGAAIQCPTADCSSKDSVFVYDNANNIVLSGPAPLSITGLANGNYTVVINGYCGGQLCLTCKFFIKVECKDEPPCNCKGSHWGNKTVTIGNTTQPFECFKSYGVIKCKTPITVNANYICGDPSCPGTVTYSYTQPSGTTTGTLPATFTPTQPGWHWISIIGYCGGIACDTCTIRFMVEKCDSVPCCPYEIKVEPKQPTYVTNPTSTTVTNNFAITIPASANITEVRANVVSYTIDDNFKGDCMKCVNLPFTWASMATATNISTAPPKITMYGGATVPSFNGTGAGVYQNPREVIWNNGTNLNSPNITNIGLSFILPPTPAIDCCELKGKICVKFTFRDDKCNECEVIGCFNFVIKKK
jgi:PKD domain